MTLYSADTPTEEPSEPEIEVDPNGMTWLQISQDAYEQSDSYFDSSIRRKQESAQAHFGNRHAPGSKYYADSYKYRAKGFRPKTRSIIRKNEAAAAKAFFSTQDVVHIQAENESDISQRISAEVTHELVNHRLIKDIKWFTTVLGAYQDTLVSGVCISHQSWDYTETNTEIPVLDVQGNPLMDENGEPVVGYDVKVHRDQPNIELRPIENIRFSASADWQDPINTSSYLIDKIPMTIGDVRAMMQEDEKSDTTWRELSDGQLQQGLVNDSDSVRSQRENGREDSTDQTYATSAFDTVWVHRNIINKEGEDWLFYTLSTHYMLSEPVRLTESAEYRHLKPGQRPYVLGCSILETHKTYPSSLTTLTEGLQQEANDINNQRRDNVSLVLNKRYYARRGSGIDIRSLTRNIPGSVTMMDDINADVRTESPPEVTGSAYHEQDRVNMDYDELAGSFSTSSVGTNRALNETVGGMGMMQSDSNEMIEYQIRMFSETWVEPVLRQIIQLEQAYETDEALLSLMGDKIKAFQKYGIDEITDQWLQGSMTLSVNVGFGATNPQKRIEKLSVGLRSIGEFAPHVIQELDSKEIIREVMGALGYKGAERFFPNIGEEGGDPRLQQMQQEIQRLQQELQSKQMEVEGRIKVAEINANADLHQESIRNEGRAMEAQVKAQTEQSKIAIQRELDILDRRLQKENNEYERGKLLNARYALLFKMRQETQGIINDKPMANPENRLSQVIANDRFQMIPGQEG